MHSAKAPGIDGYSVLFYQNFWGIIKEEVCEEILNYLNYGVLDQRMNETLIILVPKVKEPQNISEF